VAAAVTVTAQLARVRGLALSRWGLLFGLAGLAGLVLRVWVHLATMGTPDSDEAVVGLMVRHALHGQFTTFYWGQAYGGTQEVFLTVPLFFVWGSSLIALRVVPVVLCAAAALLVWRVGRRTIGEPAAGVAAALFWIWPPYNLVWLTHQQNAYASDVFYCSLLLLLALRIVERPDAWRVGLFGLVLGLAFWETLQIVPIAVPVIGWTVWKQPRCLRSLWAAVPLAILGALPWIVWNLEHGWASLMVRANGSEYLHSLRLLASPLLPMTFGLRTPLTGQLLIPSRALTWLLYVGLVALFAYGAFKMRRSNVSLLYVVAAAFPFVWAISRRVSSLSATPRFLIVLTPVLALLVAQAATKYPRAAVLLTLACVVSAVSLHRIDIDVSAVHPRGVPVAPRDLSPLISALDRLHLTRVEGDYWIAYRLDFDTRERIVAANPMRYPPYERLFRAAPRHGYVFFRQNTGSSTFATQLEARGYHRHFVGPFVIYAPS